VPRGRSGGTVPARGIEKLPPALRKELQALGLI